jgi:hypothetical protein
MIIGLDRPVLLTGAKINQILPGIQFIQPGGWKLITVKEE